MGEMGPMCDLKLKTTCTGKTDGVIRYGDGPVAVCLECAPCTGAFCTRHTRFHAVLTDGSYGCCECAREERAPNGIRCTTSDAAAQSIPPGMTWGDNGHPRP